MKCRFLAWTFYRILWYRDLIFGIDLWIFVLWLKIKLCNLPVERRVPFKILSKPLSFVILYFLPPRPSRSTLFISCSTFFISWWISSICLFWHWCCPYKMKFSVPQQLLASFEGQYIIFPYTSIVFPLGHHLFLHTLHTFYISSSSSSSWKIFISLVFFCPFFLLDFHYCVIFFFYFLFLASYWKISYWIINL